MKNLVIVLLISALSSFVAPATKTILVKSDPAGSEVILNGYKTIYLGESVPIDSLKDIKRYFDNVVYISYMTVEPTKDNISDYMKEIHKEILEGENAELWAIGRMTEYIKPNQNSKIKTFNSILELSKEL